jgi:hypothetical protein
VSFGAPWMLLGLVAVGVPLWLHLRKRLGAPLPFPALPLLQKVARKRAPKIRFRRYLLLVVRLLVVSLIVLSSAKPAVTVRRPGGIRKGSSLALVVVLDNSMSMRLKGGDGQTLFEKAKVIADTELGRLRPGDAAALVTTCPQQETAKPAVDFDLVQAQQRLDTTKPTYRRGRLKDALLTALDVLEASPLTQREVLLITDLTDDGDMDQLPPWSPGTGITLRVMDAGAEVRRANTAVDLLRVGPSAEGVAREVQVEAPVINYSKKKLKSLDVILEVEGAEVARGTLKVPAKGRAVKRFTHRFKGDGLFRGVVRIPDDQLSEDNARFFSVHVSHSISALIIDGDYRPGSYHDEAFYLLRALETPMPKDSPITSTVLDVDTAVKTPLAGFDVVFLAGVAKLPPTLAGRLIEYVKGGGGVLISPHEKDTDLAPIEPILPARIRSIRQASRPGRAFRVGPVHHSHPVFQPFGGEPTGLEATVVWSHLLVEPDPSSERVTLVETKDGLPLLLERQVERGRSMLLGVTIDRAWSDLPIRPGFLPLVQRAARHLAGRLADRAPKRVMVGEPVSIEVSQGMQRLTVRGPDKKDSVFTAQELDGRSHVEFRDTETPGDYRVWAEIPKMGGIRELDHLGFTVETDPRESDPAAKIASTAEDPENRLAPLEGKLPIWPYLLLAAFLLLLAEAVVAGAGLRRSHMGRSAG